MKRIDSPPMPTIRRRSKSREVALQALFQLECPRRSAFPFDEFISRRLPGKDQVPFCRALVMGTRAHHREIDRRITEAAENWRIERMAGVDRNIIRMAAFELLQQAETGARVIIDEAVELAKRFGSEDSPKFVNGVLDQLLKGIPGRASEMKKLEAEKAREAAAAAKAAQPPAEEAAVSIEATAVASEEAGNSAGIHPESEALEETALHPLPETSA